jgi:hypothetical protein
MAVTLAAADARQYRFTELIAPHRSNRKKRATQDRRAP